MSARVRFAPSPTGDPHLGNIRSAVFDYLFAKREKGTFIVRVEDTDQSRQVPGSIERMLEALRWLGMEPDEGVYLDEQGKLQQRGEHGPYVQSERLQMYKEHAQKLLDIGKAYRCFATAEELEAMRKEQQARKQPPRYDRRYRDLSCEESDRRAASGEPFVIRQAMPLRGEVVVQDALRGTLHFQAADLEDHVLLKSDGFPTYQLASVVDDHYMEITHVLRGEEWIPSAPKNVLLYEAFGWQPPIWVHLPLILGPDKQKLSKRHGAETVLTYRERGYLPAAVVNVLAFLGWNPGVEREFFSLEDLIHVFTLDRIQKAPAVFDPVRMDYVNGWYIRQLPVGEVAAQMRPFLAAEGITEPEGNFLLKVAAVLQERFKYFGETWAISHFFFNRPAVTEGLRTLVTPKKRTWEETKERLEAAIAELEGLPEGEWNHDRLEEQLTLLIRMRDWKNGDVLWPIRAALSGEPASPGAYEMLEVLGKEESLTRLQAVL